MAWSEPMQLYRTQGSHACGRRPDPLFAAQPAASDWRLEALHRVTTGRDVIVAVVDSRIEVNHPDLAGQVMANEDFEVLNGGPGAEAHGTGVAGIIAAKANNGVGIVGVAPEARLMALRACWQVNQGSASPTFCDSLSLARAINFAIEHNAQVINLSLSGPPDALIDQLLTLAKTRRIIVVAAFDPTLPKGGFPASQPGVIAVADKTLSPLPALVYGAPGRDIPTTQPGGKWYLVNGSSYAAAHVSGLMALVRQFESSPTLIATGPSGGVIDACATVQSATPACVCECADRPARCHPSLDPFFTFVAGAFALALATTPAHAQLSGSASIDSQYRYRGYALGYERPVATLDLSFDHPSGFYANGSITGVDTSQNGLRLLATPGHVGYAQRLTGDLSIDGGVTHFEYEVDRRPISACTIPRSMPARPPTARPSTCSIRQTICGPAHQPSMVTQTCW